MKTIFATGLMCAAVCGAALSAGPVWGQESGPFHVAQEWKIGGDGGWDYMAVDPQSKLLYVTRGNHVIVVDTSAGKQVADITGLHGTHGVVFSSDGEHGYITDAGTANQVVEFNRKTNAIEKTIPAGTGPDGAVFDPYTKTVWAFNGRSKDATVIDTTNNTVVATVALPGKPEFPVSDGAGFVYDNIEDKSEIVKLDAKAHTVVATWPVCDSPSGLAIDVASRRLFAVCDGGKMAVVDTESGKVVATPAIGDGPDAAGFSASDHYAFSSNGQSGTLTVVREEDADHFTVVQNLATKRGARTMAVDPDGSHVYVVTAEFGPRPAPTPENPRPRPTMAPGSFEVIVISK